MRIAGRIARAVLDTAIRSFYYLGILSHRYQYIYHTSFASLSSTARAVRVGITTEEIDQIVHTETIKRNAYPSPLNYHGFPKSCCTSVNEVFAHLWPLTCPKANDYFHSYRCTRQVICHGIPDSTVLNDGDIMNIDVTIFHDGVHGDCSETIFVGDVKPEIKDLVVTTYEAWKAAINFCKPGNKYQDIGGVIEEITSKKGYTSVKEFCGHGVGRTFHTSPNILHYKNANNAGTMAPGHTFTIEPMICLG